MSQFTGSVTAGAGCTNAAMLGWAHKTFTPEEGGLYAIGTCPSVGITGEARTYTKCTRANVKRMLKTA